MKLTGAHHDKPQPIELCFLLLGVVKIVEAKREGARQSFQSDDLDDTRPTDEDDGKSRFNIVSGFLSTANGGRHWWGWERVEMRSFR